MVWPLYYLMMFFFTGVQGTSRKVLAIKLVFDFAKRILHSIPAALVSDRRPNSAVHWLHSLIDGDLDVDRCDYILRDAQAFGFEFSVYDLGRLINHITVVDSDDGYVTAVKGPGLSSVESFLLGRYRFYQVGVRHHKVSQAGAALRHCISKILEQRSQPVVGFVNDLIQIVESNSLNPKDRSALLNRFSDYDDNWWFTIMKEHEKEMSDEWFALVCWRKPGPKSLWKRVGDFPSNIADFNEKLPDENNRLAQDYWFRQTKALRNKGVLVVRHKFSPWSMKAGTPHSQICIGGNKNDLKPISQLSNLVFALQDAWRHDVQVQAFKISTSRIKAESVASQLSTIS